MVHELLGIIANRVDLRHIPGIKKEFEEVVLQVGALSTGSFSDGFHVLCMLGIKKEFEEVVLQVGAPALLLTTASSILWLTSPTPALLVSHFCRRTRTRCSAGSCTPTGATPAWRSRSSPTSGAGGN